MEDCISIERNISYARILELFETSECGIHTMKDEHFGITCVDFQASGTIPVGHNSAGPKMDIIVDFDGKPTGFLAENEVDFAEKLQEILELAPEKRLKMQNNARNSCFRFSAEKFRSDFIDGTEKLF